MNTHTAEQIIAALPGEHWLVEQSLRSIVEHGALQRSDKGVDVGMWLSDFKPSLHMALHNKGLRLVRGRLYQRKGVTLGCVYHYEKKFVKLNLYFFAPCETTDFVNSVECIVARRQSVRLIRPAFAKTVELHGYKVPENYKDWVATTLHVPARGGQAIFDRPRHMDVAKANEALAAAKKALDSTGKRWWVQGGTLLGIIRDGTLLPHDHDLDVALYLKDYDDSIHDAMFKVGFTYKMRRLLYNGDRLVSRVDHYRWKGLQLDVLYWHDDAEQGKTWYLSPTDYVKLYSMTRHGIDFVEYNGGKYPIPSNPKLWLQEAYGSTWNVPMLLGWNGPKMTPVASRKPEYDGKAKYARKPA